MTDRDTLAAALDLALAALQAGASLESVLAADPTHAAQLRPLLIAARAAGAGADLSRVPAGALAASRSQFLAAAAERRPALVPVGPAGRAPRAGWRAWLGGGSSWLARAAAVTLVVLGGLGLGGYSAVAASAQSLPGDPLYGVKRSVEQTELLLAANAASRAKLQTEFDDRRVQEAQAVASAGRQVAVDFTGTLVSMDGLQGQHWLVSGVAVQVGPQVPVTGTPRLGARVRVEGTVQSAGLVQAQRVTVLPDETPLTPAPTAPMPSAPGPTATATATGTNLPTSTLSASLAAPQPSGTPAPTALAPVDTQAPADTATVTNSPAPTTTQVASATEDHGGGPGPSPSNTPKATDDGGGGPGPSASNTPQATDDGGGPGPSASNTPQATDDGGGGPGPSASNTPQPTEKDNEDATSRTPAPTDDGGGGSGSGGPSPSNTPKPSD